MNECGRFSLEDPWRDPERLFPSFMASMKVRYPNYLLAYDHPQERWVVVHKMAPHYYKVVAPLEYGDGVSATPCIEFLDYLSECEVLRNFATMKEYCDWLEKESERVYQNGTERMREEMAYAARPIIDYVCRGGPESIVIRPLPESHRAQIDRDLALSVPGAVLPEEAA